MCTRGNNQADDGASFPEDGTLEDDYGDDDYGNNDVETGEQSTCTSCNTC